MSHDSWRFMDSFTSCESQVQKFSNPSSVVRSMMDVHKPILLQTMPTSLPTTLVNPFNPGFIDRSDALISLDCPWIPGDLVLLNMIWIMSTNSTKPVQWIGPTRFGPVNRTSDIESVRIRIQRIRFLIRRNIKCFALFFGASKSWQILNQNMFRANWHKEY